ncbi:MAG: hypothetical protein IJC02_05500 [Lachnospiraceae bacterium]|nr:hypothetical protein [Lachnospiraceae bacterium]MBQ6994183.1 hypothetical protein [Lachnospiraceae bacterium]
MNNIERRDKEFIYPSTRITEEDKRKLFKDEEIDMEAWNNIVERGFDVLK